MPKTPGVIARTGIRTGHLAAVAVYTLLVIVVGVAMNLDALTISIVVLLPIAVIVGGVLASRRFSTGSDRRFETTGATTTAKFSLSAAPDAVKEIIKGNIRRDRRFHLLTEDPTTLLIETRVSAFTWGERIVITLQGTDGGTRVEAECRHKQRTAIIDFGQSKRDLQTVLQGLDGTSS